MAGRYVEADGLYTELLRRQEDGGAGGARLAHILYELGAVRKMEGRCEASSGLVLRGLRILQADAGDHEREISQGWRVLGSSYYCSRLYYKAEDAYRRALDIESRLPEPQPAAIFESQSGLGAAYQSEGRFTRAEQAYQAASALLAGNPRIDARAQSALFGNLGSLLRAEGRYAEAESALRQGLAALENSHPNRTRSRVSEAYLLNNLAMVRMARKDYRDAGALLARGAALIDSGAPVPPADTASLLHNYALCLRKTGEKAKAKEIEARASQLAIAHPPDREAGMVADVGQLARGK